MWPNFRLLKGSIYNGSADTALTQLQSMMPCKSTGDFTNLHYRIDCDIRIV